MRLTAITDTIKTYWAAKTSRKPSTNNTVKPLFPTTREPEFWQIGAIVRSNGGHTKEFSWKEELKINQHLMAASFGDVETSNFIHDQILDESKLKLKHI